MICLVTGTLYTIVCLDPGALGAACHFHPAYVIVQAELPCAPSPSHKVSWISWNMYTLTCLMLNYYIYQTKDVIYTFPKLIFRSRICRRPWLSVSFCLASVTLKCLLSSWLEVAFVATLLISFQISENSVMELLAGFHTGQLRHEIVTLLVVVEKQGRSLEFLVRQRLVLLQ